MTSERPRFTATFDSERPLTGIVLDEERSRYARFPTMPHAERAAAHLNDDPSGRLAANLLWRSTATARFLPPNEDLNPDEAVTA